MSKDALPKLTSHLNIDVIDTETMDITFQPDSDQIANVMFDEGEFPEVISTLHLLEDNQYIASLFNFSNPAYDF